MSSAILYLAIVAIWAVVLVPRWLYPRAAQPQPAEQPGQLTPEPAGQSGQLTPEPAGQSGQLTPEPAEPLPLAEPPRPTGAEQAEPMLGDVSEAADSAPPAERADVLQGRRRMLGTMVVLTAGAAGLAATGIAAFWVVIPPVLFLAGFLVLLREASRADAQRAGRATRIDRAATSPVAGEALEPYGDDTQASPYQVPVAALLPGDAETAPDAEVIDISGRVSDQVYDQYADAAERAVGD